MWRAALLVLGIAMAACGGGSPDPEPDAGGGFDPPPFVPGPNLVTLTFDLDPPFYVRYRDGEGPWTRPLPIDGSYELHITNAYDVVAICGGVREYEARMLKRTFDDGEQMYITCFTGGLPAIPTAVTVTGTMVQAGEVNFGSYDSSPTGPWSFALDVEPGTHDLIAVGPSHILIGRDQVITTDTSLPTIDVVQDGVPLDSVPFGVGAQPGETISSAAYLVTANEYAFIRGQGAILRLPPASVLKPFDLLRVAVSASTARTRRSMYADYAGQTYFPLLPQLAGIEYSFPYREVWATWSELPAHTEIVLNVASFGVAYAYQTISCTESYLAATHTNYLSFYPMPDDYDTRFTPDLIGPHVRELTVYDDSVVDVSRDSSVYDQLNFP